MAWSSLLLSFSSLSFCRPSSSSFPLFSRSIRSLRSRLSLSWGSSVTHTHKHTLSSDQKASMTVLKIISKLNESEPNPHPAFFCPYPGKPFSSFSHHPRTSSSPQSVAPCVSELQLLVPPWRGTLAKRTK